MSKRKYRKGEKITSLDELAKQEFVYFCHKITHRGWFKSWQFRLAESYIGRGMVFYAVKLREGTMRREKQTELLINASKSNNSEDISNKQIEEMAKDLCHKTTCSIKKEGSDCYKYCNAYIYAFRAINAGYRKQEWISVDERLPDPDHPVLMFTRKNSYYVGGYYKAVVDPKYTGFYADSVKRDVTHWMPLPEPPEMKGGAG